MKKLLLLLAVFILVSGVIFAQEEEPRVQPAPPQPQPQQPWPQPQPQQTQPQPQPQPQQQEERRIEFFNFEASVAFPVHWTNGQEIVDAFDPAGDPIEAPIPDRTITANTAFGLSFMFNFTNVFGLTLDLDIFYGAKIAGFSSPSSDYNSLFGVNAFLGPVFYIINTENLRIPFSIGAHLYFYKDELWVPDLNGERGHGVSAGAFVSRTELQFGPGIYFGVQFHFDKNIYIFSRTSIYLDIARLYTRDSIYNDPASASILPDYIYDLYPSESEFTFDKLHWTVKPSIGLGVKF